MAQPFPASASRPSCSLKRQQFRAAKPPCTRRSRRTQRGIQAADRDMLLAGDAAPQPIAQLSAASSAEVDVSKLLEDAMKAKSAAKAAKAVAAPPSAPAIPSTEPATPFVDPTVLTPAPAPAVPVAEAVSPVPPALVDSLPAPPSAVEVQLPEVPELPDIGSALDSTVGSAASSVAEGAQKLQESLDGGLTALTSGVDAGVGQAVSTVTEGAEKLQGVLGSLTGEANKNLGAATSTVTEGAQKLSGAVTSQLSAIQSGVGSVTAELNSVYSSAVEQVESAYRPVAAQVEGTVAAVTQTVNEQYLPTAVKYAGIAGVYAEQAAPYAAVGGVLALAVAYNSFKRRYAGFAGELAPEQVRELLLSDTALLVDIRSLEEREKAGLPELKLKARFKAVVWEPIAFVPTIKSNQLNGVDELVKDVNAAYIGGLSQVSTPLTKFIILDTQGSEKAREVARALKRVGYSLPFIMEGGFDNWVACGLPTVSGTVYEANVVNLISDEIEVTYTRTVEALQPLADPWLGVPVLAGAVLGVFAVANYHKTLEYIGVLSLLITVEKKLFSYSSPADLLKDVTGVAGSVTSFVGDKVSASLAARAAATPELVLATDTPSTAESASYVEAARGVEPVGAAAESAAVEAASETGLDAAAGESPNAEAVEIVAEVPVVTAAAAVNEASGVSESDAAAEEKKPVEAGTTSVKESPGQSA